MRRRLARRDRTRGRIGIFAYTAIGHLPPSDRNGVAAAFAKTVAIPGRERDRGQISNNEPETRRSSLVCPDPDRFDHWSIRIVPSSQSGGPDGRPLPDQHRATTVPVSRPHRQIPRAILFVNANANANANATTDSGFRSSNRASQAAKLRLRRN